MSAMSGQEASRQVAAQVRAALAFRDMKASTLSDILEVSPRKARNLYHGRAEYFLMDLLILARYFDVPVASWLKSGNIALHDPESEDRAVTARESAPVRN